jgi:HSP20 family protein
MSMRDLIPWGRQSSTAPVAYQTPGSNPVASFRREFDRMFDDLLNGSLPAFGLGRAMTWPHVELSETDRELRVSVELPGMNERDVELTVDDGVLTIRGEKRSETDDKDRGYSERFYGRFERRVALPSNVDEGKAEASFRDGVLMVTLPKSAEAESIRRIPINGGTRH